MKAELLLHRRQVISNLELVEMKIWRVPCVVPPCDHEYKYSLVYIKGGKRILGFDNERGKGDHIHQGGEERMYQFVDPETLILDFLALLEECRR